jgi:hypothetical protein
MKFFLEELVMNQFELTPFLPLLLREGEKEGEFFPLPPREIERSKIRRRVRVRGNPNSSKLHLRFSRFFSNSFGEKPKYVLLSKIVAIESRIK